MEPVHVRHEVSSEITIAADHWGDHHGRQVVFLHGGGQTRHSWGGSAARLARAGIGCITVDMRGHGESSWHRDGAYQLSDYATDIASVVGSLDEPPVLVGASLGGLTGVWLEGEMRPGSLSGLVLVDIVPRMNQDGANRVLAFMRQHLEHGFATLDEAADAVAEYNPNRPRPSDLEGLQKNLRWKGGRWYWHWDPRMIPNYVDDDGRISTDEGVKHSQVRDHDRLSQILASVEVPLMLVRGRMSDLVTIEIADQFRAEFPHAAYVDVSGAGHMVAGDRNDAFTDAVASFLSDLPT